MVLPSQLTSVSLSLWSVVAQWFHDGKCGSYMWAWHPGLTPPDLGTSAAKGLSTSHQDRHWVTDAPLSLKVTTQPAEGELTFLDTSNP